MRYPFANENEFNFNDELQLPTDIHFTDIDGILRSRFGNMLAIELKRHTQLPGTEYVPVSPTQNYTNKFLARAGIPAFYLIKQPNNSILVYYVDCLDEPRNHQGKLMLPITKMKQFNNLEAIQPLLYRLLQAADMNHRDEVHRILKELGAK